MNSSKSSGRIPPALLLLLLALVTQAWAGPAPVDPYRVSTAVEGVYYLHVTASPGTVGPGSSVSLRNVRTQQSILVAGLPDGSFDGLLLGISGDRLQLQVMDAAGSASATTEIYAAASSRVIARVVRQLNDLT